MSAILPNAARQMRIIAIPLTRPNIKSLPNSKASRILTYYQFQISPPRPPPAKPSEDDKRRPEGSILTRWIPEGGVAKWTTEKAAGIWAGFGKAKEGSWKLRVYQGGERLVDRMDFEELALKGIDPSLGPEATSSSSSETKITIPLIYPPSISSGSTSISQLRFLVNHRTPRHRKGFFIWMFIAPLTAPFMIIPIIPNLPFFFCVWRSWSHYRAYRSSQYLQSLLDTDTIVPEPSQLLDTVYEDYAPSKDAKRDSQTESEPGPEPHHTPLLTRDAVPAILSVFGLKPSASADLHRAVEQARVRVKSGREVL